MKEIKQLLAITQNLKTRYKRYGKNFTLDGRLVGDIGEVLAAEKYGLELYPENNHIHDAIQIGTKKEIQIKASFNSYCYFPCSHVPDYFLAINILHTGEIQEMFNGPGQFLKDHYVLGRKLKGYKNVFYTLSRGVLEQLNKQVPPHDKIQTVAEINANNVGSGFTPAHHENPAPSEQ